MVERPHKDKIKHTTMISDIADGGLNLTDFDSKVKALRAMWAKKVLNNKGDWTFWEKAYFSIFGPEPPGLAESGVMGKCNFHTIQ